MPKRHIGLLYGGRSSEHDVSIRSARSVFNALDRARYRVTPIRIARDGRWHVESDADSLLANPGANPTDDTSTFFSAGGEAPLWTRAGSTLSPLDLDVAVPMLHGQNGEDGRVQGLLHTLGVPYVGPDVLSSAACMDKEVTKRLLRDAGLPIVPFRMARPHQRPGYSEVAVELGKTLFVKPANSGSSVGTSKADDEASYQAALDEAFRYDRKVLIESAVTGREIECAVIGNEAPRVAIPGEIVSTAQFYTYDAKYEDPDASRMEVPADLPEPVTERLRALATDAYRALGCEGMARVDFFVTAAFNVFVNEINTIPGFTERSMFPVMWDRAGLPLPALVDELIDLALARHERDAQLKTTR